MTFLTADGDDDVETLVRLSIEQGDIFRGVLQIAIHDDVPASPGVIDAGGQRVVLAEVTAELDAAILGSS